MLVVEPKNIKVFSTYHRCDFHKLNPFTQYAGCTCSGSLTSVALNKSDHGLRSLQPFDMTHVYREIRDNPAGLEKVGEKNG